jgi:hypothetical protein
MNKYIDFVKVLSGLEQAREYASPEIRTIYFQPEGVLCSSVFNEHQGFEFDDAEDL